MNICNELRVSLFLQARVISSFHFISPFSSFFLLRGSGAPEPFLFVPQKGAGKRRRWFFSHFSGTKLPPGEGRRAPLGAIPCPKAPLCKGSWLPLGRLRSCSSKRPRSGLPAWWGRFPLGVPFARPKGTKTRLGRSPLRTSLGYEAVNMSSLCSARYPCCGSCHCHHTRPLWQLALWLGGFHLRAFPGEAAFPPPSARPPAAGNSCTPG